MSYQPTDPPMEPYADTATWFESDPDAIVNDLGLAVLIVRVGMASNALNAQWEAGAAARRRTPARKVRDILASLVTSAALTNEAIRLASEEMKTLRQLAAGAGASEDLLTRMGRLCGGEHPSAEILKRARNEIGFHWDKGVIRSSVHEYRKNQKIVWLESDPEGNSVHRLAVDVLAHALFPGASSHLDREKSRAEITTAMAHMDEAMRLITEFFTACVYGYLKSSNATRRTRVAARQGVRKSPRPRARTRGRS